ncbi:MAG TPA: HDOD domain-containing protein [Opitutaceae bacterium]|nr:HDOD domain-containing protein [Opitutaceae bacterium]
MTVVAPSRDSLLHIAQQLPASPQVLMQLNELLTDVNSGLDDVANLLRRDTGLAARIIRISNSAVFGMGGGIATVEEAVNRVGYAEIYRLTGIAAAVQMAEHSLNFYGITGPQLRDHTLVTAMMAEALATRAGAPARVAYTVALLRSTGKLVVDRYLKKFIPAAKPFLFSRNPRLLAWEESVLGSNNAEIAQQILTAWRFPQSVISPVRNQYSTSLPADENRPTAQIVQLACTVAYDGGFGLHGEREEWSIADEDLRSIGLDSAMVAESREEAVNSFELLKSSL